jgi:hypothetical protein
MLRRLRLGAYLIALLAPASVHAQFSVFVNGGVSAPLSTLQDFNNIGYNVGGGVNIGIPFLPFGLRLDGAYNGFGIRNGGGDTRIIMGTADAVFNIGPAPLAAPYLIGGVGIYSRAFSTPGSGYGPSQNAFGLNGGGGLRIPLSGITTFFEARYHIMLGSAAEAANYQFVPVTVGIAFPF